MKEVLDKLNEKFPSHKGQINKIERVEITSDLPGIVFRVAGKKDQRYYTCYSIRLTNEEIEKLKEEGVEIRNLCKK